VRRGRRDSWTLSGKGDHLNRKEGINFPEVKKGTGFGPVANDVAVLGSEGNDKFQQGQEKTEYLRKRDKKEPEAGEVGTPPGLALNSGFTRRPGLGELALEVQRNPPTEGPWTLAVGNRSKKGKIGKAPRGGAWAQWTRNSNRLGLSTGTAFRNISKSARSSRKKDSGKGGEKPRGRGLRSQRQSPQRRLKRM